MKIKFDYNRFRGIFNQYGGSLYLLPQLRIYVNRNYYYPNNNKLSDVGIDFNWIVFHFWISFKR